MKVSSVWILGALAKFSFTVANIDRFFSTNTQHQFNTKAKRISHKINPEGPSVKDISFFLSEEELENCKEDLLSADTDSDGKVISTEWPTFVEEQSGGKITQGEDSTILYGDLPLPYIMLFINTSCKCVQTQGWESLCCIGPNANVDISPLQNNQVEENNEDMLYFLRICVDSHRAVDHLIVTEMPSSVSSISYMPTLSPTINPTSKPTSQPSLNPTPKVTPGPTLVFSTSPTQLPSSTPTLSPIATDNPTTSPEAVGNLTLLPTLTPTSNSTTVVPTQSPTKTPSTIPTKIPTLNPTKIPSMIPTVIPTKIPSITPSESPSITPSESPSIFTSTAPTKNRLLDFIFSYGIVIDGSLDADDVMNENNNTVKNDLVIATATIVSKILNETYPCVLTDQKSLVSEPSPLATSSSKNLICPVIYTDEHPVVILTVLDDTCIEELVTNTGDSCVVIRSRVTVLVIDETLVHDEVKNVILEGLRNSFQDGSFLDAIPNRDNENSGFAT